MAWDAKRAAQLVGRTVVLRMVLPDADPPATRERHGTIAAAAEDGITVRAAEGGEFTIPPELGSVVPSTEATPMLGGKRPDLESVWTVVGLGTGEEAWTPGAAAPAPRRGRGGGGRGRGGGRAPNEPGGRR